MFSIQFKFTLHSLQRCALLFYGHLMIRNVIKMQLYIKINKVFLCYLISVSFQAKIISNNHRICVCNFNIKHHYVVGQFFYCILKLAKFVFLILSKKVETCLWFRFVYPSVLFSVFLRFKSRKYTRIITKFVYLIKVTKLHRYSKELCYL